MPVERSALLVHLRDRFGSGPENLATEALAFILDQYQEAREGFVGHCRRYCSDLPNIDLFRTQSHDDDGAIPDLTGWVSGKNPLVVEVKFHAGLTQNQPVTYLQRLHDSEDGGLLLFLVPNKRVPHVWEQLKARCTNSGLLLHEETPAPLPAASSGNVRIGVTGWSDVLNVLQHALEPLTPPRGFWELQQLRSLCAYEDQQIFEPLEPGDLQRSIGRRIGEFRDLAFEVVGSALDRKLVSLENLRAVSTYDSVGRYFKLKGWECWLGVHWGLWATQERQSPMWLFITDRRAPNDPALEEALRILESRALLSSDGYGRICIDLPTGKDRDSVIQIITKQIEDFAALMPYAPSGANTASTPEQGESEIIPPK